MHYSESPICRGYQPSMGMDIFSVLQPILRHVASSALFLIFDMQIARLYHPKCNNSLQITPMHFGLSACFSLHLANGAWSGSVWDRVIVLEDACIW